MEDCPGKQFHNLNYKKIINRIKALSIKEKTAKLNCIKINKIFFFFFNIFRIVKRQVIDGEIRLAVLKTS